MPTLFKAYEIATSGEPGPVFVELPVNILLLTDEIGELPPFKPRAGRRVSKRQRRSRAPPSCCAAAKHPCIFAGWGTRDASNELVRLAEWLEAPVATTLQGLSVFPANHPLHVGFGFGASAVPAAQNAFKDLRLHGRDRHALRGDRNRQLWRRGAGEPDSHRHQPRCVQRQLSGQGRHLRRCRRGAEAAAEGAGSRRDRGARHSGGLREQIRSDKAAYRESWYRHDAADIVNPARFFDELRRQMPDNGIIAIDDGNHTFLTAELMPIHAPKSVILPTDFNCMGYAVPAAIGAKLACPGPHRADDRRRRRLHDDLHGDPDRGQQQSRHRLLRLQRRRARPDRAGAVDPL